MTTLKYSTTALLFCLTTSLFAEDTLPIPTESASTTNVAVRPLSYDKKDIKLLYGVHLAENTGTTLPEPKTIASDVIDEGNIKNARLEPPAQTEKTIKNSVDIYATGGAGFANLKTGGTIINPRPRAATTYNASSTSTNAVYGAAAAYTFKQVGKKPVDISLGAAFYGTSTAEVKGNSATSLPGGFTFRQPYNYDVSSKAAFFEQRATYHSEKNPNWQPYVVTGFGPGWNTLSDFNGSNGIVEITATQGNSQRPTEEAFANETTRSFAYEAGVGILRPLSDHFAITADYRYMNFGKGELGGLSLSPQITDRLSTDPISENTVLVSLKASFNT